LSTINIANFPDYFTAYRWVNPHHASHGYSGDRFPGFPWIKSLEERGAWLASSGPLPTAPTDYIRSLLAWGAGKNDPTMRFEAGLGNVCLRDVFNGVVAALDDPERAITAALQLPGCGLTYASKLLRFLRPDLHASLDSRIRDALLKEKLLDRVSDGNLNSMVRNYVKFQKLCSDLVSQLDANGIKRPDCALPAGAGASGWRVADVEMALFMWAANKAEWSQEAEMA